MLSLITRALTSPCPRSSNTLFVGVRISRPLLGDGARPVCSIIFPLHENCREACAACAASIIAAMANPTIAVLNIVFLRIDGSLQSQAVRREHGPGETSRPADDPKCRLSFNRVVLTVGRSRPVCPDQRTFAGCVGMSQRGQPRKSPRSLDYLATIPKDGPVTRSHPSLGTQRFETRVASGSITALGNVVGRTVAIRMQIEDSCHNTKMSRRP